MSRQLMWHFAFSVSLEGAEGTEECKGVEGDQVYTQLHKGGHCRAGQGLICSHQGSQLWHKDSNNCEICPLSLIVGTFLFAESRIGILFSLILNSYLVVSYVLLARCQMDHVPFYLEWDLENPRAVKGLDPFTQPPHRQGSL